MTSFVSMSLTTPLLLPQSIRPSLIFHWSHTSVVFTFSWVSVQNRMPVALMPFRAHDAQHFFTMMPQLLRTYSIVLSVIAYISITLNNLLSSSLNRVSKSSLYVLRVLLRPMPHSDSKASK